MIETQTMIQRHVGIIGFGNMGRAIVHGLLTYNMIESKYLFISDRSEKTEEGGIAIIRDNKTVAKKSDTVILAVKPQQIPEVLEEIKQEVNPAKLIISVAAGISIATIKKYLYPSQPVVRVMPLLTAMIGLSMSVWMTSPEVSPQQKDQIKKFLKTVGEETEVTTEEQVDSFTALAGGPAYVFYLAELLEKEAVALGFSPQQAKRFSTQIVFGSASLLEESSDSPYILRQRVTSKGGTTEAALRVFEKAGVAEIFHKGILASKKRAEALKIGR